MKLKLWRILFLGLMIQFYVIKSSSMSFEDLFNNSYLIAASTESEESATSAAVLQQQAFISSDAYEQVISTMQSSGVMNDFENLILTLKSGFDVDQNKMTDVVSTLHDMFINMVQAYNEAGITIMNSAGNGAYSYFSTIVLLYVARIRYLASCFLTVAQSGEDYSLALSELLTAFSTYEKSLQDLTNNFPSTSTNTQINDYYATLPTLAMSDYYTVLADIILTKILSVLNFESAGIVGKYDRAVWAIAMYNSLMEYDSLHLGTGMYTSFDAYQSAFLTSLYTIIQTAITEQSGSINFITYPIFSTTGTNPNEIFFQKQEQLYADAVTIYQEVPEFSLQYTQLSAGLSDATNKYNAFENAAQLITDIRSELTDSISSLATLTTFSELGTLIGQIQTAMGNCTTAQSDLILIGDAVSLEAVQAIQNNFNTMYWLAYLKYYWCVYLEDTQSGGVALKNITINFDNMADTNFANNFTTISNSMNALACMQSLQSVQDAGGTCSSSSANLSSIFNSGYDLSTFISYAISLVNTAPSLSSIDQPECCDYALLESIKTVITSLGNLSGLFSQVNQKLQTISAKELSNFKLLFAEILIMAQNLDNLYLSNLLISDYLPNLAVQIMPSGLQTFFDMSLEIIVYLLGNLAQALTTKEKYLEAATCYALLEGYAQHLSAEDQTLITNNLHVLTTQVDLGAEAANILLDAKSESWSIENNWMQNQSWLSAIQLYQLAYEAIPSDATLMSYDQAIQDYIAAYKDTVAVEEQEPLDLLYPYYLLMMNYNATNNGDLAQVTADLAALFQNDSKTGFFDLLNSNLLDFINEKDSSVLSEKKEAIADLMTEFENELSAEQSWIDEYALLFDLTMNPMLSVATESDGSKTYGFTFDQTSVSTVIPDLDTTFASVIKSIADSYFSAGKTASANGDFISAYTNYTAALTEYKMIINQTKSGDLVSSDYLLTKTLAEASLMASLVLRGDIQTINNIPDVALTNLLSSYSFTLPTVIASTISQSDLMPGADGKTLSWSNDKIINILKLVALNSELTNSGYIYGQLFTSGTTNILSSLNDSDKAIAQGFIETAESYISIVSSAMTSGNIIAGELKIMTIAATIDSASNITISCSNMPIAPLISYYADHPNAAQYYGAALMLFASGTDDVQVANTVYIPGNDDVAAQKMRLYTAATAMATTKIYVDEIANSIVGIQESIANATTLLEQYDVVSDFETQVKSKYNKIIAILLDPETGAIKYYQDNNSEDFATNAQNYAMDLYQEYQTNIQLLLVGDPTSSLYTSILYDLNLAYQTQAVYTSDSKILNDLKIKTAELFKNAGDACMVYTTITDSGITKHYYENAAVYYNAAVAKYTSNNDVTNATATQILEYVAYAKDGLQNAAVYLYAKINGTSYVNMYGKTTSITLDQLIADYKTLYSTISLNSLVSIDTNETILYTNIETLFLDGAMVLSAAASGPTLSSNSSSDESTSMGATYLQDDIITFLQNNNIELTKSYQTIDNPNYVDAADSASDDAFMDGLSAATSAIADWNSNATDDSETIDTNTKTISIQVYSLPESYDVYEQILKFDDLKTTSLAIQGVDEFATNKNKPAMSSWLTILFNALAYIYMYDYLGVTTSVSSSSSATDAVSLSAEAQEEFYQRLQAQGVANQNPASIYMG